MKSYLVAPLFFLFLFSCQPAEKKKPNSLVYRILYALGKNKIEQNDLEYAKLYFIKSLEIEPGQIESKYALGYCYSVDCSNGGDCDTAIFYFNEVVKVNPLYRKTYYNRGVCRQYKKEYAEALKDYGMAISLNDKDGDYYYSRGNTFVLMKDTAAAIKDFELALKLGNKNARRWLEELKPDKTEKED
jgi:tetratricopeptide (TPR) repeat protein